MKVNVNRFWKLLFIALMSINDFSMGAIELNAVNHFEVDGLQYSVNSDGSSVTIIGTSLTSGELVIPSSVLHEGYSYSVSTIGQQAFYECSGLTGSLSIPSSVTTIGDYAFAYCSGFSGSLSLGSTVTKIGSSSFYKCSGFVGSLSIPNTVVSIGEYAFSGCSGLVGSLIIPNSVTQIGKCAFSQTGFENIELSNQIKSLANGLFSFCKNLKSIELPPNLEAIEGYAFQHAGLSSITIPQTVTSIGEAAFYNCKSLNHVSISDLSSWCLIDFDTSYSMTQLGGYSNPLVYAHHLFLNDVEIANLVVPETINHIKRKTFAGCSFFKSITLHDKIVDIGEYAFYDCTGLESINSKIVNIQNVQTGSEVFFNVSRRACRIKVPKGSVNSYSLTAPWNEFEIIEDIGDFNNDGYVDLLDYKLLSDLIVTQSAVYDSRYDLDDNGTMDAVDANILLEIINN